jgi:hypothetical protein
MLSVKFHRRLLLDNCDSPACMHVYGDLYAFVTLRSQCVHTAAYERKQPDISVQIISQMR